MSEPAAIADFFVRRGAPDDDATVTNLLRALHLAERGELAPDDELRRLFGRCDFLVAQAGEDVAGALAFEIFRPAGFRPEPGHAVVMALTVAPAWRRRGVASRLIADLREALRGEGCASVLLYARPENKPALAFYRAMGFARDGEALTLMLIPP